MPPRAPSMGRCAGSSAVRAAAPAKSRARRAPRSPTAARSAGCAPAPPATGCATPRHRAAWRSAGSAPARRVARSRLLLGRGCAPASRRVRDRRGHRPRWRATTRPISAAMVRSVASASWVRTARTSGWLGPSRPSIDCSSADNWSCRARSCTTDGAIAACAAAPARPVAASSRPSASARALCARASVLGQQADLLAVQAGMHALDQTVLGAVGGDLALVRRHLGAQFRRALLQPVVGRECTAPYFALSCALT